MMFEGEKNTSPGFSYIVDVKTMDSKQMQSERMWKSLHIPKFSSYRLSLKAKHGLKQ